MLMIRMARFGSKKQPYYRIVVIPSRNARNGTYLENIGTYNPRLAKNDPKRVQLDVEKAKAWMAKGAQPSDRVVDFLAKAGVMAKPQRNSPQKSKPKAKAQERAKAAADKAAAASAPAST